MREYIVTEHPDFPYEDPKPQELIRCKDCEHFMPLTEYSLCVVHGSDAVDADDFCSWAERKETEDAVH